MDDDTFNPSFYCPITAELMRDPVIDREGNSYERIAIEEWIALKGVSPITRNPLHTGDLAPNRALREAIADALRSGRKTNIITNKVHIFIQLNSILFHPS